MIKHSHLLSAVAAAICSSDEWLVHKPIDDDNDRNGGAAKWASVDVLQLTIGGDVGYDWPAMATAGGFGVRWMLFWSPCQTSKLSLQACVKLANADR